jgi:hypothetical protein
MPFLESNTMTIPASTVRLLCTSSEVALVRASRKGELEHLSAAQVKRLAVRARKLLEKWQDLGRDQSRVRSRKVGVGDVGPNTRLKEQIFRETLTRFEERLPKAAAAAAAHSAKKSRPKTKKDRNAAHRSARAVVRQDMSEAERLLNAQGAKNQKPAAHIPAAVSTSLPPDAAAPIRPSKAARKTRPLAKTVPPAKRLAGNAAAAPAVQRKVTAAAKKARLVSSGKMTRMLGHIASRGKRAQARRDGKK